MTAESDWSPWKDPERMNIFPRDPFQDFDISYFVADMNSFKENDDWLARQFDDCCNEFWNVSTYVVKGLARNEILFAIDHLNGIARPNLLRMMTWQIGSERGYTFSVGKNYKFINHYLPKKDWEALLSTFAQHGCQEMWQSLFTCYELFRKYAKTVAGNLEYVYPDYDEAVTRYTASIYSSLK